MTTNFFTNRDGNTLLEKFKGAFDVPFKYEFFDVLVGYFRASGYFAIRPYLENIPKIRIIVGIDVDRFINEAQTKGLLFTGDEENTIDDFLESIKDDIQSANYTKKIEDGILQFIEDIATEKIELRAHPTKKLHAKFYILKPEGWSEHIQGSVITGSSNLTAEGLGSKEEANYEFNVLLTRYDDVLFAAKEFEILWHESLPILAEKLASVKKNTYLNDTATPFDMYYKMLIEYFGNNVDFDPNSIDDLPSGFKRLSYQIDAVSQGFDLLKKHNGFFLADVVGLGKTIVAILIAKKFFYSNGYPSHISRILIIVPPALRQNWENTCHKFGLNEKHIRIINNGSLHKINKPQDYDLIIVDEAHKFRNDTSEAYDALQQLCKTSTTQVLSDGTKVRKSIILVSATPLNNRPGDIRNLVYLFQDAKDSTLDIVNLQSFFAKQIKKYKEISKKDIETVKLETAIIYEKIREFVIAPLTVRRTRRDLMENKQYAEDLKTQNIIFPEAKIQTPIYYQLEPKIELLYDETIKILNNKLTYNRYQAIAFLVEEKKKKYQTADLISKQLSQIMKTLLIKRLDSSFFAFKASLNRFLIATNAMITMFNNNRIFIAPNLPVTEYIVNEQEDELLDMITTAMETDPTIEICSKSDFVVGFFGGLQEDYKLLKSLHDSWEEIEDDPKLEVFCEKLEFQLLNSKINPTGKVVVFSESKETSSYLYENLKLKGYDKVLCINAGNRKEKQTVILENFDANISLKEQKNDYDIIISTEVLSEGVNLHRSNVIVNYDTPWNATKLMQRIGRVNRIGSTAEFIYVYNCYPTSKVDSDINLKKKAIQKLQAFHSALGEDSQIYSKEEEVQSFGLFGETVKEDKDERLTHLMELRKFKEENPDDFRRIKKMSKRSRVGRKNDDLHNSTVTFLRNKKRDIFYKINVVPDAAQAIYPCDLARSSLSIADKQDACATLGYDIKELPFLEAVSVFKADIAEIGTNLHDKHHEQVNVAIDDFHNKQLEDAAEKNKQTATQKMTPIEKSVVNFLAMLKNLPHLDDESLERLTLAMEAIGIGKFQKLPKKLSKLNKAVKKSPLKADVVLSKALEIINEYPLDDDSKTSKINNLSANMQKPEIIISESFVKK